MGITEALTTSVADHMRPEWNMAEKIPLAFFAKTVRTTLCTPRGHR
jgi:hypothetical protein